MANGGTEMLAMNVPSQQLPADEPVGKLEPVVHFDGAMPTGVTVSHQGRIFVNFPKWGDRVEFTVAEIRNGQLVAYPNEAANQTDDGYLYVTANQLHRQAKYQKGQDLRHKPYTLFRVRIDARPVLLR
jgi:sugar lactone lactonase YvrE